MLFLQDLLIIAANPVPIHPMSQGQLFPSLSRNADRLLQETSAIGAQRTQLLEHAAQQIVDRFQAKQPLYFSVVCTHNARRSQIGQAWLNALATYHGLSNITAFSAGTETSAFHPNAVKALQTIGFQIEGNFEAPNPHYQTKIGEAHPAFEQFSKTLDDPSIPQQDLVAIMVCRSADEACPFVPGASLRLSIPFEDPGKTDQTPEAPAAYLATVEEIGRSFNFLLAEVKQRWNKKA